jgi:alkylation response protein AidB-like acyl-CoA dehydrogenase
MGCSALPLSVHSLACHPLMVVGTDEQRQEWLPEMLSGRRARARFPALGCQRGLSFGKPGQKMGLRAVPTTSAQYDDAYIPADRRVGKANPQVEDRRPPRRMTTHSCCVVVAASPR